MIAGQTGSAKTQVLRKIAEMGGHVLDLESLAVHRGSILGSIPNQLQPSQKFFESCLLDKLMEFPKGANVFIESESSKIGNIHIPNGLWAGMCEAPFVEVKAPLETRAAFLEDGYLDLKVDKERLKKLFRVAQSRISSETLDEWRSFLEQKAWKRLALSLIKNYYDPAYRLHKIRYQRTKIKTFKAETLSDSSIKILAKGMLEVADDYQSV